MSGRVVLQNCDFEPCWAGISKFPINYHLMHHFKTVLWVENSKCTRKLETEHSVTKKKRKEKNLLKQLVSTLSTLPWEDKNYICHGFNKSKIVHKLLYLFLFFFIVTITPSTIYTIENSPSLVWYELYMYGQ